MNPDVWITVVMVCVMLGLCVARYREERRQDERDAAETADDRETYRRARETDSR